MKRLLLFTALLLVPVLAAAEGSDQLLTLDGTMYSIAAEPAADHPNVTAESSTLLVLSARRGDETVAEVVPPSLDRGWHYNPSLAYEPESGTVFVFWIRNISLLFNELLFASRDASGTWSTATVIGDPWDFRENLRIAVTRKVDDPVNGTSVPGISVHATWWEFDSGTGRESARYSMMVIDRGAVVAVEELDLSSLIAPGTPAADPALVNRNLLKQPVLFPARDHVRLLFGDLASGKLHQVTIRPSLPSVPNGRIRIPVGRSEGETGSPSLQVAMNSTVEGISDGHGGMALYTQDGGRLRYVLLRDGVWSTEQSINLDDRIRSSNAVDALRRLVREH